MTRNETVTMLARRGVTLGDGFAFRTDVELELAVAAWSARGAPAGVHIEAEASPDGGTAYVFTPRVECAESALPSADPVRYAEGVVEPFCCCGRRISECDGSRAGCRQRALFGGGAP